MTEYPSHNRLDPSSLPRPTLLVVEDDPQLMGMLQIVLKGAGFDVVLAWDGRQALDTLARAQREEVPVDLVMMDLNMPVMDGRECLRQLGHRGHRVPVLLLSGDPLDDLEEDLLNRVAGLLQKPVGLRTLLGQVRRILEQGGQAERLTPH